MEAWILDFILYIYGVTIIEYKMRLGYDTTYTYTINEGGIVVMYYTCS